LGSSGESASTGVFGFEFNLLTGAKADLQEVLDLVDGVLGIRLPLRVALAATRSGRSLVRWVVTNSYRFPGGRFVLIT
jgi:hypothetical protein